MAAVGPEAAPASTTTIIRWRLNKNNLNAGSGGTDIEDSGLDIEGRSGTDIKGRRRMIEITIAIGTNYAPALAVTT